MEKPIENSDLNTKIQQGQEHFNTLDDYLPVYHVYNRYAREKLGMNEMEAMNFSEHVLYDVKWLVKDDEVFWTWYHDTYVKKDNCSPIIDVEVKASNKSEMRINSLSSQSEVNQKPRTALPSQIDINAVVSQALANNIETTQSSQQKNKMR